MLVLVLNWIVENTNDASLDSMFLVMSSTKSTGLIDSINSFDIDQFLNIFRGVGLTEVAREFGNTLQNKYDNHHM